MYWAMVESRGETARNSTSSAAKAVLRLPRRKKNEGERMTQSVLVIAGERLARYGFGDGHPFGPDRHAAFLAEFSARGLDRRVRIMDTRAASRAELESFHTAQYVDRVEQASRTGEG